MDTNVLCIEREIIVTSNDFVNEINFHPKAPTQCFLSKYST